MPVHHHIVKLLSIPCFNNALLLFSWPSLDFAFKFQPPSPLLQSCTPPLTLCSLKHTRLRRLALHCPRVGSVLADDSYAHHLSHLLHPPQPLTGIAVKWYFLSFQILSLHICLFVLEFISAGKLESSCLELSEAVPGGNVTAPICVGKVLQ